MGNGLKVGSYFYKYYGRKKYCHHFFLSAEIENAVTFFL